MAQQLPATETSTPMIRPVKRQRCSDTDDADDGTREFAVAGYVNERSILRSLYEDLKVSIVDDAEELGMLDSEKFISILHKVQNLHQFVRYPREQVADAEALLGISNSLLTEVKVHRNDGITCSGFVTCLLKGYTQQRGRPRNVMAIRDNLIDWKLIGLEVSQIFRSCHGCHTMIGPMDVQLKQRKSVVRVRRKINPTKLKKHVDKPAEESSDTAKIMATMFKILKNEKTVMLEHLVLNRNSFAQTVENVFALSFLVKDGRVAIEVNDKGCHLVSPRNAPPATAGKAVYRHFVFRFDYKDWELMASIVGVGEELMPHRNQVSNDDQSDTQLIDSQEEGTQLIESREAGSASRIRKLCRNVGMVLKEEPIEESGHENENTGVFVSEVHGMVVKGEPVEESEHDNENTGVFVSDILRRDRKAR